PAQRPFNPLHDHGRARPGNLPGQSVVKRMTPCCHHHAEPAQRPFNPLHDHGRARPGNLPGQSVVKRMTPCC
ncbi:hypothetical protein CKQ79_29875, partial [Klebsiella pneumoniae]